MKDQEYGVTRPDLYEKGSLGHDDVSIRQGHYYLADSTDEAIKLASRDFSEDRFFDIQAVEKCQFTKPCRRVRIGWPFTFEKRSPWR